MLRAIIIYTLAMSGARAAGAQTLIPPQPIPDVQAVNTLSPTARDPHKFLEAAKQQLDALPSSHTDKETRTRIADLREDLTALIAQYQGGNKPTSAWMSKFYDVERDLASILGLGPDFDEPAVAGAGVVPDTSRPVAGQSSNAQPINPSNPNTPAGVVNPANPSSAPTPPTSPTPPMPTTPGASPSPSAAADPTAAGSPASAPAQQTASAVSPVSGVAVKRIGVKGLDPAIRSQLEQLRTNIELFLDATTSLTERR